MSLSDVADLSMSLSDVAVPINGDAEQRFESGNENFGQFGTRSIMKLFAEVLLVQDLELSSS